MAYNHYSAFTATHPRDAFCTQLRLMRRALPLLPGMKPHDRNVVCIFRAFKAMGITSGAQGERYIAYLEEAKWHHTPPPFKFHED